MLNAVEELGRFELDTAATELPLTLDECKQELFVLGADDDSLILRQLRVATETVEQDSDRSLLTQTWKVHFSAFSSELEIRKPPVSSVSSITYLDGDGNSQTLASSVYETDLASENLPARIHELSGQTWPVTTVEKYNAVTVTFVAGWATQEALPSRAKQAVIFKLRELYHGCDLTREYDRALWRIKWTGL